MKFRAKNCRQTKAAPIFAASEDLRDANVNEALRARSIGPAGCRFDVLD
jgi:hypothetical protein